MNDIVFNIIISTSAGAVGGIGLFYFLSKRWVSNWFEKDLKKYQNKLDIIKIKDEIRFDVLHHEMANRISKLFSMIADEYKLIIRLFPTMCFVMDREDMRTDFWKKHVDLQTYLVESSIFFPTEVESNATIILSLFSKTGDMIFNRKNVKDSKVYQDKFNEEYTQHIRVLRDVMKDILGVDYGQA